MDYNVGKIEKDILLKNSFCNKENISYIKCEQITSDGNT